MTPPYMWNLKRNDTNELTKQKETHRLREQTYGCQRGIMGGRESQGVWDRHVYTAIFKMDYQQGPPVQFTELYSMLCGSLDGKGVWGRMYTCKCMAESLCCPPETIATLLISYTPI